MLALRQVVTPGDSSHESTMSLSRITGNMGELLFQNEDVDTGNQDEDVMPTSASAQTEGLEVGCHETAATGFSRDNTVA